jgi:hypothetical protein
MGGSMNADKRDVAMVIAQFALLLGAVAFVDRGLVRTGLVFIIGLLLVQRALGVGAPKREGEAGAEQREDSVMRDAVSRLLVKIREFYTTCHLLQSEQISPAEARQRTSKVEKELNTLLAEVVRSSRGEAVPPKSEA